VLITSRSRKDALAVRLNIKPLDDKPAAELLAAWSGQAIDAETTRRICAHLGGLPVAVRIVGHYLRNTDEPAAEYLRWLDKEPLGQLSKGKHRTESVAVLLQRSVAQVSDDARQVLALAGTLAYVPISGSPVAVILDDDDERCRDALNELVNYGLLERQKNRWQISHALIHTYARTELPMSKESLERLAWYYLVFCVTASKAGLPGYARLDGERAHCLRLMKSCLNSKLWQEVKRLVWVISDYLDRQGYWVDQLTAIGMRLIASRQAGDYQDEGWCLNSLGYTCERRGEYEKALDYYQQSLKIHSELGDRQGEGAILNNIAATYNYQSKYELSLQHYQQSLSIKREGGDRRGEGTTLGNIGQLYHNQGKYEQALEQYGQCLPIMQQAGDEIGVARTLSNIGLAYREQGNPAKALEYYHKALVIRWQRGDRVGETLTCWNVGTCFYDQGNRAKAEEYISQAVQLAEAIGHPLLEKWREGLKQVRAARQE
jgi:tetratricopeptide (TPR) repeat protein